MTLRDKVKRAFHRSSHSKSNSNGNGIKIEYYRRSEIPRSKFRGPFDPDHQKRLAQWNFQSAMEDRPRSPDLALSPCATLPLPPPPPQHPSDDSTFTREQTPLSDDYDSMYFPAGGRLCQLSNILQVPPPSFMTSTRIAKRIAVLSLRPLSTRTASAAPSWLFPCPGATPLPGSKSPSAIRPR